MINWIANNIANIHPEPIPISAGDSGSKLLMLNTRKHSHVYTTVEAAKRAGSTQLAVGLYTVMEYARDMSVLGVSPKEGVRQHVRLYQAIRAIAGKSTDAEFVGAWSAMLAIPRCWAPWSSSSSAPASPSPPCSALPA